MSSLKIGAKLGLAFGVIVALPISMGFFAISRMAGMTGTILGPVDLAAQAAAAHAGEQDLVRVVSTFKLRADEGAVQLSLASPVFG